MSPEVPFNNDESYALYNLVPKEVAKATTLTQAILEDDFDLKVDIDHLDSTGIVIVRDPVFDVLDILEAIYMVMPETISVIFDKPNNSFLVSQSRKSLN